MNDLYLTSVPVAEAAMLIRQPVARVFETFVNPEITTKFWFTGSTGKLEKGKQVIWTWEMYNHSIPLTVKDLERNKRILIEWGNYGEATIVEWKFTPFGEDATYVSIKNYGFKSDGDKVVSDALDSKGGFAWVLAAAKAWLEHGINLNLIADAFPPGLAKH